MVDVFLNGSGEMIKQTHRTEATVHPLHQQKNGGSDLPVTRSQPQERSVAFLLPGQESLLPLLLPL